MISTLSVRHSWMGLLSASVQTSAHYPLILFVAVTSSRIPTSVLFERNPAEPKRVSLWLNEDSVVRIPSASGNGLYSSGNKLFLIRDLSLYLGTSSRLLHPGTILSIRERSLAHPGKSPCPYVALHNLVFFFLVLLLHNCKM